MSSISAPSATSISDSDTRSTSRITTSSTSTNNRLNGSVSTASSKSKSAQDVTRRMICGGVAGMIAKTVTNPLERIKMLSQTGEYNVAAATGTAHATNTNVASRSVGNGFIATIQNISQIYRSIIRNEGILGLWAGNGVNLLRVFPNKAIIFSTNDMYTRYLHQMYFGSSAHSQQALPPVYSFLAGGLAGMTATAVTYPLDLARGRIAGKVGLVEKTSAAAAKSMASLPKPATEVHAKVYSGMIQTILVTIKDEGFLGLYKGITPTLLGAMPYVGIQFGTVGLLEKYFGRNNDAAGGTKKKHDPLQKMLFGGIGGIMAGLITYPNDTIRRMLQLQGSRGTVVQYNGYIHCLTTVVKEHGVSRLYRGWTINMIRMAPNTAVIFGSYELLKHLTAQWSA